MYLAEQAVIYHPELKWSLHNLEIQSALKYTNYYLVMVVHTEKGHTVDKLTRTNSRDVWD